MFKTVFRKPLDKPKRDSTAAVCQDGIPLWGCSSGKETPTVNRWEGNAGRGNRRPKVFAFYFLMICRYEKDTAGAMSVFLIVLKRDIPDCLTALQRERFQLVHIVLEPWRVHRYGHKTCSDVKQCSEG